MKLRSVIALLFVVGAFSISAQDIVLPTPVVSGGMSLNDALSRRHSVRSFDAARELPMQTLSDLLWAAVGVNRPDTGMRTNPTARNCQEIEAYVFNKNGVYKYDALANKLMKKADGDHRKLVAGTSGFSQSFVLDAPVSVVYVADLTKFKDPSAPSSAMMGAVDAGIACQNLNLFCTANGLATVPRATMDKDGIAKLLGLTALQLPLMNNPVGYEK